MPRNGWGLRPSHSPPQLRANRHENHVHDHNRERKVELGTREQPLIEEDDGAGEENPLHDQVEAEENRGSVHGGMPRVVRASLPPTPPTPNHRNAPGQKSTVPTPNTAHTRETIPRYNPSGSATRESHGR